MELFIESLLEDGVELSQIQSINFEAPENEQYTDWRVLYSYLSKHLEPDKMNYIFLDEIQNVKDFERAVDGLYIKKNVDLYITGSNAHFLSSELATLLSGRYVEISMLPLSFKEFIRLAGISSDVQSSFIDYVQYGSFPQVATLYQSNPHAVRDYLLSLYDTVLIKDIMTRRQFRDLTRLKEVLHYVFDVAGTQLSSNNIAKALTESGKKISNHTVDSYLEAFIEAFLLYPAKRFDLRGKATLQTNPKFYLVDTGLRNMLLGREGLADRGRLLENIIFLELLRRGNDVWVGKIASSEIDFVAKTPGGYTEYYQVAWSVRDDKTLNRELLAFNQVKDHNPKYLLTLDPEEPVYRGIRQINALNWLLN
jgi:predicted AAA+ superfamily ATPase